MFDEFSSHVGVANFQYVIDLFNLELQRPVKMAHKLYHKVCHPGPIEKQSVLKSTGCSGSKQPCRKN